MGEIIANRAPIQANKKKTNRQENINEIQRDTTNDLLGGHRSCPSQPFDTITEKKNIKATLAHRGTHLGQQSSTKGSEYQRTYFAVWFQVCYEWNLASNFVEIINGKLDLRSK